MREAWIDSELCDGCQKCLGICAYGAIGFAAAPGSNRLTAVVDLDRCCGCIACGPPACPQDGIDLRKVRA